MEIYCSAYTGMIAMKFAIVNIIIMQIIKKSEFNSQKTIKAYAKDSESGYVQEFEFRHSAHSLERASQRCLNNFRIRIALVYGHSIRKQGYEYCILGEDRIPEELIKYKDKLKNTVVVMDGNSETIVTCYRAKDPYKHIRKKSKTLLTQKMAA
jgi:hypothetical protein